MEKTRKITDRKIVANATEEALREFGKDLKSVDKMVVLDGEKEVATLEEFVNVFWDKAIENVLKALSHS